MNAPSQEELLKRYLEGRDRQRLERAEQQVLAMTRRERRLVREAAVMGFVQGIQFGEAQASARHAKGTAMEQFLHESSFPRDHEILLRVLSGCDAHSDLYPVISHLR